MEVVGKVSVAGFKNIRIFSFYAKLAVWGSKSALRKACVAPFVFLNQRQNLALSLGYKLF